MKIVELLSGRRDVNSNSLNRNGPAPLSCYAAVSEAVGVVRTWGCQSRFIG